MGLHHAHTDGDDHEIKNYTIVLVISIGIFLLEIIGGIISNSLALVSDSFHVLLDSSAAAVAILVAFIISKKIVKYEHKVRGIGGIINSSFLFIVGVFIVYEAIKRIFNPPEIKRGFMLAIAVIGFFGNLAALFVMQRGRGVNITHEIMRVHILSDALQSVAVIVGAAIMYFSNFVVLDPLLSLAIVSVIIYWSVKFFRKSVKCIKGP